MGARRLIPILSKRTQAQASLFNLERADRIAISAREQAKQWRPLIIEKPQALDDFARELSCKKNTPCIVAMPGGDSLFDVLSDLKARKPYSITLVIGPEGGFDSDETSMLSSAGSLSMGLTPSILRSQEAVCLALGAVSSVVFDSE